MPNIILKINNHSDKIYDSDNICCYLADASLSVDYLSQIASKGKMMLLFGDAAPDKCLSIGASGVVVDVDSSLPVKKQIRPVREKIGPQRALGVVIAPSRHEAMLAAETEPEFVCFRCDKTSIAKAKDIITWYNELFLIQSAADLSSGLVDISGLDVDFVIINSRDYKDFGC